MDDDFDEEEEEIEEDEDMDGNVGGNVEHLFQQFTAYLESLGFEYLNQGGFRKVYQRKGVVIKVPHVGDGIMDNRVEAAVWRKYKNAPTDLGVFLCPCRLLPNGCLMMRSIDFWDFKDNKPDWARQVDSQQVGLYRGKAVAYDYALDNTERAYLEEQWGQESVFFQAEWLDRRPYLRKKEVA
jgi:hypothetical protein